MGNRCKTPGCGTVIPPQVGKSRPRLYCEKCRPSRKKKSEAPVPVVQLPTTELADLGDGGGSPLVESYRARLVSADRLDTPEGALVMLLAATLASGGSSASGAASLSRELRAAMDVALKDAPREADKLDELAARRIQKANGA